MRFMTLSFCPSRIISSWMVFLLQINMILCLTLHYTVNKKCQSWVLMVPHVIPFLTRTTWNIFTRLFLFLHCNSLISVTIQRKSYGSYSIPLLPKNTWNIFTKFCLFSFNIMPSDIHKGSQKLLWFLWILCRCL